jgi:hypothetical protein
VPSRNCPNRRVPAARPIGLPWLEEPGIRGSLSGYGRVVHRWERDRGGRRPAGCASQTGKVVKVKVLAFKGLASRNDPKSCAWDSDGPDEALIGERAGQVWSCEILLIHQSADVVRQYGRRYAANRYARLVATLRSLRPCTCSETPCTGTGRACVRPEDAHRAALGNPRM